MENEGNVVTWIDISKLKQGCRVDSVYSECDFNSYLCVSDIQDFNDIRSGAGVTSELKPNTLTHETNSIASSHKKYFQELDKQQEASKKTPKDSRTPCKIPKIQSKDIKNGKIFSISNSKIPENELISAHSQIDFLSSENKKLLLEIESLKQAHISSIEDLQARHEKKYSHRKQGFEEILNEIIDSKEPLLLSRLSRSHLLELSNLKSFYEREILKLRLSLTDKKSLKKQDSSLESTSFLSELSLEQPAFALSPSSLPSTPEFPEGCSGNFNNAGLLCERTSFHETLEDYQGTVDALSGSLLTLTNKIECFRNGIQESLLTVNSLLKTEKISQESLLSLKIKLESLYHLLTC
jgi:hypothetical protein